MCFRAEDKTAQTLDRIAADLDVSRADLLLSMTKFALTNHDWARFGLTHKPLPFGYGTQADETRKDNPMPIKWTEYNIPGVEGKTYEAVYKGFRATVAKRYGVWSMLLMRDNKSRTPLGTWESNNGQASGAKAWFEIVVDSWDSLKDKFDMKRKENPTMKTTTKRKPTPAQLAARERFAEMARSGAFKKAGGRKANPAKKTHVWRITVFDDDGNPAKVTTDSEQQGALLYAKSKADANMAGEIHYILPKSERLEFWFDGSGIHPAGSSGNRPIYTTRRAALRSNPAKRKPAASRRGNPAAARRVKFVCIAPMEYSGAKYGIDERTPVTMKFSEREMKLAHKCYQLPEKVVMNDDFQNFAYHNKVIYMSVAQLRQMLREYA